METEAMRYIFEALSMAKAAIYGFEQLDKDDIDNIMRSIIRLLEKITEDY